MKIGVIDTESKMVDYLNHHLGTNEIKSVGVKETDKTDEIKIESVGVKETDKLFDIAKNVAEEKYDAIAINIEGKYENANRSALKGIELIFWLRLKHKFTGPIISYGFLSLEEIMKKYPQYTVLFAKGNQHFTLGVDTNKEKPFTFNTGDTGLNKENLFKSYTPHIKNLFSIDVARHEKANWWAIKTMWDIHNITIPNNDREDYPQLVKDKLKILNNYLTTILFRENVFLIEDYVKQLVDSYNWPEEKERRIEENIRKAESVEKDKLKQPISEKRKNIESNENEITQSEQKIESIREFRDALHECGQVNIGSPEWNEFKTRIDYLQGYITLVKEENIKIQKEIKELESLQTVSEEEKERIRLEGNEYNDEYTKKVNELTTIDEEAKDIKLKILLIDDMASNGWKDVYEKMFPKSNFYPPDFDFDSFKGGYEEKISSLKTAVTSILRKTNTQAIILDIRLFPEDNSNTNEELSGFQLLTHLNEEFPGIPVMITTASNKIWTFKDSLKKGADGYWMKEGLDNFFTNEESLDNYIALTKTLKKFGSKNYISLHILGDLYEKINAPNTKFWWENHTWKNFDYLGKEIIRRDRIPYNICETPNEHKIICVKKESVKELIKVAIQILKRGVQTKDLFGFDKTDLTKTYQNSVAVELWKIIEKIHSPINVDDDHYYKVGDVIQCRGDFNASLLYGYRNYILHISDNTPKITNLDDFLNTLSRYLLNPVRQHFNHLQNQERLKSKWEKLADQERQRLADQERLRLADQEKQRLADQEKQRLADQEKQRLADQEKQRLADQEKQRLADQERQRLADQERIRLADQERIREQETVEQKAKDTKEVELIPETPSIGETGTYPKEKSLIKRIYNWFKHLFS